MAPSPLLRRRRRGRSGTLTADLVVGADGVGSAVRAAGHFEGVARRTGHSYLRAIVADDRGTDIGGEYWTTLGLFGGARIDEHHLYFYADVTSPSLAAAVTAGDLHLVRSEWALALPVAGDLLGRVQSFDDLLINDVTTVRCRRWYDGRLVLLGDAAHAMSPTAGQGANSAMVDAAVLTAELMQASGAGGGDRLRPAPTTSRAQGAAPSRTHCRARRNLLARGPFRPQHGPSATGSTPRRRRPDEPRAPTGRSAGSQGARARHLALTLMQVHQQHRPA